MATKESKALDKTKPYGTIRGRLEGFERARFSQEGRIYDAKGELLFDGSSTVEEPPAPEVTTPAPTVPVADVAPLAPEGEPVVTAPTTEKQKKKDKAPLDLPGLPKKD